MCVGHKKEEAYKEVRTLASASAACLPGATNTWPTASMGRWASGNQTPGGPAGARRLLACLDDKGAGPCTFSVPDTTAAMPRWRWHMTPPHLLDHLVWRNNTLGSRSRQR